MRLSIHILSISTLVVLAACNGDDDEVIETGDTGDEWVDDDTTAPTVTISDDADAVAAGDVTFTFTFSEDVGDTFAADDVTVAGGTAGAFASDGTSATIVVSPPAESTGTITVDVAAGAFEDAAGNANTEAASASQDYDTMSPVVQTVFLDFESETVVDGFGELTGGIVVDPTDSSNSVAELNKGGASQSWAGATVGYCDSLGVAVLPLTADNSVLTVRVWSPDADVPFLLKLEDTLDANKFAEVTTTTTKASEWETLTFDFADVLTDQKYDKVTIFPNFGTDGATAGEKTYYVDDFAFPELEFSTDCPEPPPVDDMLTNGNLESVAGDPARPTDWLIYPGDLSNWASVQTGETMFNTDETFVAFEGDYAMKVWGQSTGGQNETPVYQEFSTEGGKSYTFSGMAYMHSADAITAGDTYLRLEIKFFDDFYNLYGTKGSTQITNTSAVDTWTELSVSTTAPDGATKVQASVAFWQCFETTDCYTGGSVYVDDLVFGEVK